MKGRWSYAIRIAIILTLAALFIGCTDPVAEKKTERTDAAPRTIAMLVSMTADTPFFVTLLGGAIKEAERLNMTILERYAADDPALQSRQIKEMIAGKVDAILLNPVSGAVVPAVEEANRAGIPVFTFDRSIGSGKIASHTASDNVNGGKMAGAYMTQALGGSGKVVELQGTANSSAADERGAGFNEAIDRADAIEVVARQRADFNRAKGKDVFAAILAGHQDIDGVFAHNDDMILGALEAAREAGRHKEIIFVGFDAVDDAVSALQEGSLAATVAQQPAEIGRMSIKYAAKYLDGETVPASIPVDLALITR